MEWKDAKSFQDLCNLMQKSLMPSNKFYSFASCLADTGCVLEKESLPYVKEFIELNQSGFLTIDSQPGLANSHEECIVDGKTRRYITNQRNYLEGFIEKRRLFNILPKLNKYIVSVQTTDPTYIASRIICSNDYHLTKIHGQYIFIPGSYQYTTNEISNDNVMINLTKYHMDGKVDKPTNLNMHLIEDRLDEYFFDMFNDDLREWMIANTFLIMIVATDFVPDEQIVNNPPESLSGYGSNNINKLLISLLQD